MVYLIHFERPLHHARHYIGYCKDGTLPSRLEKHMLGTGSKLMRAVTEAGIQWHVVKTWNGDRTLERKLHNRHGSQLCHICNKRGVK